MLADRPLADGAALARWFFAFVLVVGAQGWFLVARHCRRLDLPSRFYLGAGFGLLTTAIWGVAFSALGVPFTPETALGAGLLLAWALGRSRRWREAAAGVADDLGAFSWREACGVVVLCGGMAAILLAAFRGYAAPNHLDDASNHAFMVARVMETHSLAAARVFAPPFGRPAIPYLLGWHGSAALVAEFGRVPPWIGAWYLAALSCVITPVGLTLLWRAGGLPRRLCLLGGAFAVANFYMPTNIFSWGGFGAIIGLALAPCATLALRAAIRAPSTTAAVLAGTALVAVLHVHTSEVFTAPLLLIVAWPLAADRRGDARRLGAAVALIAAVLLVAGFLPLLGELRVYRGWTASEALPARPGLVAAFSQFLTFAGGNVPSLRWFVLPGLVAGLIWRPARRFALLSIAFLLLYLGLRQFQDPLSLTLAKPFYRQFPRVVFPQMYLIPPLMAVAVGGVLTAMDRRWRWPGRRVLALVPLAALVHWVLYPGAYWAYRNLEAQRQGVPFTTADARLAHDMARALPGNAVVANQYGDGSFWAMHVSGLRFLDPCSWPLGQREGLHHRPAIARLLERPWPPEVRALRDLGTGFVYVGDTVLAGVQPVLRRDALDRDPRFARLLDDGNAAVYRILWDTETP